MSVHIQLPSLASNDFVFPFISSFSSSSCFTNHRYSTTPLVNVLKTQKQKSSHFRICSAHQDTNPTITIPTTTTASTSTTRKQHVATYLTERLGFSEEQSLSTSKKLLRHRGKSYAKQVTDLISVEKADNVITYLQEYCGLELSQVSNLISKYPRFLTAKVDKTIKPKIKLLEDLGFSTSDLAHVLSRNPFLYLICDLSPAIQALRVFLGNDEDVVRVFKGLNWGPPPAITKKVIPNVNMLENDYGIPRDKLIKFMTKSPQTLMRNTESLRDVLVRIEEKWGITRDSTEFLRAIHVFSSRSNDNINSKCQVFRSYGWSDSDILSLIRRNPYCLTLSEAGIKNKLDFYINEVGYRPADLASRPNLLTCSLENRVVPRHTVLSILKEKGHIKPDYQLYSAIGLTDHKFFDRFIRPFKNEVPELCEFYINGGAPTEEQHLETSGNEPSTLVALE